MNTKMKNCKACGAEVAKSAKTCPNCGAKLKMSHPILFGVLILIILAGIIGAFSGGSDTPTKVEDSTPTATEETITPESTVFSIGETAELKNITASLVNISETNGSPYNQPSDGNIFVLCEFEIANNSNEDIVVSSLLSFNAYCDDYACSMSLSALIEKDDKNQLDGTIAAGKKMNGVIGYEVPINWHELEISFTPDVWNGQEITFIAVNDREI